MKRPCVRTDEEEDAKSIIPQQLVTQQHPVLFFNWNYTALAAFVKAMKKGGANYNLRHWIDTPMTCGKLQDNVISHLASVANLTDGEYEDYRFGNVMLAATQLTQFGRLYSAMADFESYRFVNECLGAVNLRDKVVRIAILC